MSVVIATFNAEAWIGSAVRSALAQTMTDIEVIVADDASTDSTISAAQAAADGESRVIILTTDRNGGPAAARNRGFAAASGQWIAVFDSDDLMARGRLERLVAAAEAQNADAVGDDLILFSDCGALAPTGYLRDRTPRWITAGAYLEEGVMFGPGQDFGYLKPLFRRSALERLALTYDERLRIAEDDDFILRLLLAGAHYWCEPSPTYFYRRHDQSTSYRLGPDQASAIERSARELALEFAGGPFAAALRRRARAAGTAAAFARLIGALKLRDWRQAFTIAASHPRALAMLRMPLAARIRRLFPAKPPAQAFKVDSAVLHSLREQVGA